MFLHQLFFYLTILLLPTQLGLHFWPDWTLVLGRRVDYLSPTLFLTDMTIITTLLLWICSAHKIAKFKPFSLIIFFVFALCHIFFSISPYVTFLRWLKVFEFGFFGYYILQTKPSFKTTSFFITIAIVYSSLIAITQFVLQHSIGGIFWYLGERSFDITTPGIARINWCWPTAMQCIELLRPYATFPHPNVLAGFLIISICICLYNRKINFLNVFSMTVGVIALILTFSRSAWIIGAIGMCSIVFFIQKKRIWIIGLLVCIGLLFRLPYFFSLFQQSESVIIRNELSLAAISMWIKYPLIGVGLNAFLVQLPEFISSRYMFFLQPPHSIYLLVLSELGIIGVCSIGWLIYKLITKMLRLPNKIPLVILLIYGLLGTIDHYPLTVQQGQLLTTLVITLSFFSYVK